MSSVVNKSGTRFTPRLKGRRAPVAAAVTKEPSSSVVNTQETVTEPLIEKPSPLIEKPSVNELEGATQVPEANFESDEEERKEEEDIDDRLEERTVPIRTTASTKNASGIKKSNAPVSLSGQPIFDKSFMPSQTSTQVPPGIHGISVNHPTLRSSRLRSLSKNLEKPHFKPSFNEGRKNSVSSPTTTRRRLSSISNNLPRTLKNGQVIESENSALNTLKRRRLSTRTNISKKSGSTHRISIVPKIQAPVKKAVKLPDPIARKKGESDLYGRTDEMYEKYQVKNSKEIPKNMKVEDSAKYLIDEDCFTMAELCKRTLAIGEVSDNFERAQEARRMKLEKRKQRRELRMKARDQFKSLQDLTKEEVEREKEERKQKRDKLLNSEFPEDQYRQSTNAPQLKLNKHGDIGLDEESTVVDRHKNATLDNFQKQKVDENPFDNLYNYGTYGRATYTEPWTPDEMVKFYKALAMWGTDFNLLAELFPYRTRRQVKSKFTNEETKHPVMIELALRSKLPPDFDSYCKETRKDLGTVESFNEKVEALQKAHAQNLKELEKAKELASLEDLNNNKDGDTKSLINKKTSGGLFSRELKSYRKGEVVLGTIDDAKRKRELEESISEIPAAEDEEVTSRIEDTEVAQQTNGNEKEHTETEPSESGPADPKLSEGQKDTPANDETEQSGAELGKEGTEQGNSEKPTDAE
ncbi:transcription factor TFIIIB subunit BDP1 KNAG_0H02060 [Huiozyma naganishii CBS 8797]|uniref:Myb-like domain-containing protein n=1 Tax=Huiozyma naganishii (strain ATCC MYA-139 / BCRC 22969 / CBS 8797 / KCTC 17520 / NBRC 10181 / NCYC 3082 / Yp74L-3) TaxID=1071383 RepID=J7R9S3_HUIN7|nr:hypothetical protein KNAG_0H02060 [Kazachstania naganishii CBS 8797]CCK71620.1 hypothetical protein KNAG_0H02060 [Kazachstania naganishii CBS 8797]